MGNPVELLCFSCLFEKLLGLLGSGAETGKETFRLGAASGSAGRPRRGALGAEIRRLLSQLLGKTPSPSHAPAQTRRGRGSAHIWPPRSHIWNAHPRTQMLQGLGESKNPKGGFTAGVAPPCSPGSRGLDWGLVGVLDWERGVGMAEKG